MIAQLIERNMMTLARLGEVAGPKVEKPHGRRVHSDKLELVRPLFAAQINAGASRERAARIAAEKTGVSRHTIIGWHRDGRLAEEKTC